MTRPAEYVTVHAHQKQERGIEWSADSILVGCPNCEWQEVQNRCQGRNRVTRPGEQCRRRSEAGYQTCGMHAGQDPEYHRVVDAGRRAQTIGE